MQIYTVTFCTMDPNAGANPLWHTCILLSRYDEQSRKMEMVENWGFYGMPATDRDSLLGQLKVKYKVDTNISGNHGWWRHEDVRYLDLGHGLHGVTFELTAEQFAALQVKCRDVEERQNRTLNVAEAIGRQYGFEPLKKFRNHQWEHLSPFIDQLDKAMAEQEGRERLLAPFDLHPLGHTCKVQVLHVLTGILTDEQIERVTGSMTAISRFSGPQEDLYLHSTGPFREFTKSSGEVVKYRHKDDAGVRVFWTVPPQEMEMLTDDSENFFKIDAEYVRDVKTVASKLQRLEWLFINSTVPEGCNAAQQQLIRDIRKLYNNFATIKPKNLPEKDNRYCGSLLRMFGLYSTEPQFADVVFKVNLEVAQNFLSKMYMLTVDSDCAGESVEEINDDPEMLVTLLPEDKQQELCKILNRPYFKDEEQELYNGMRTAQ